MKLNKEQLIEMIRDTIYEVLEEELDRKLEEVKKAKASGKEQPIKEAVEEKKSVEQAKLEEFALKKKKLKEVYKKLQEAEKKWMKKTKNQAKVACPAEPVTKGK